MLTRQRLAIAVIGSVAALSLAACSTVGATEPDAGGDGANGDYVHVVKITGIAWFDRMSKGVEDFASESGLAATQTGPATADTELQVGIVQSLIAKKPKAIGIVPLDPGALENVIKQAKFLDCTCDTGEVLRRVTEEPAQARVRLQKLLGLGVGGVRVVLRLDGLGYAV